MTCLQVGESQAYLIGKSCSCNERDFAVYVMDEISDLSKSSPDQADSIAEAINKKLQNKSPIVKWKVCEKKLAGLAIPSPCITICMLLTCSDLKDLISSAGS